MGRKEIEIENLTYARRIFSPPPPDRKERVCGSEGGGGEGVEAPHCSGSSTARWTIVVAGGAGCAKLSPRVPRRPPITHWRPTRERRRFLPPLGGTRARAGISVPEEELRTVVNSQLSLGY